MPPAPEPSEEVESGLHRGVLDAPLDPIDDRSSHVAATKAWRTRPSREEVEEKRRGEEKHRRVGQPRQPNEEREGKEKRRSQAVFGPVSLKPEPTPFSAEPLVQPARLLEARTDPACKP